MLRWNLLISKIKSQNLTLVVRFRRLDWIKKNNFNSSYETKDSLTQPGNPLKKRDFAGKLYSVSNYLHQIIVYATNGTKKKSTKKNYRIISNTNSQGKLNCPRHRKSRSRKTKTKQRNCASFELARFSNSTLLCLFEFSHSLSVICFAGD